MIKSLVYRFQKHWPILILFILIISFSQVLILKTQLEFGFSPDDIRSFADFSAIGPNPFSRFSQVYQILGPHSANPIYYNGILYTLFGFNYQAYQVAALIFKILSVISFYLLIQVIFKNRFLSFISGLIYSFHYGSVGSMEMVARTQDYLVITGLNIFFILFYLIFVGRLQNILWLIFSSIILFASFFINPIRAYPVLPFICFLAVLMFMMKISLSNFYRIARQLLIIFLPFMLFFGLQGTGGVFYGNAIEIIQRISVGNLQMLLAPFSSFGSLFLQNDGLKFLSSPTWALSDFPSYLLGGPLIFFGITTFILSKILFKKSLKFFLGILATNFLLELLIFLSIDIGRNLPDHLKMTYDPYTFTPTAVLGVYIIVLTAFIFIEWLNNKQNKLLALYLLGITFTVTFIWLTWILYSIVHIPMGIYGYSTIPSQGVSVAISTILVLAYSKFKNQKSFLNAFAPSVFFILLSYFFYSNNQIQTYLKTNMDYGDNASDQVFLKNKFWNFLKDDVTPCNNFFFLETTPNEQNGLNYSYIMIDRFDRWYSLYSPYNSKEPCPVALLVSDEAKLLSNYTSMGGKKGFLYKYFNGGDNFFSLDNFYAFRLQNRDIIDIKPEILKKLILSPK